MSLSLRFSGIKGRVHWLLSRAWEATGVLELCALALMGLWLGIYLQVNLPLRAENMLLHERVQLLQDRHKTGLQPDNARKPDADISKNFAGFLPDDSHREQQLGKLHQLTDKHGLQLARVDYRLEPVPVLSLQRLSLRLNIQGAYGMQRQFMRELLVALPNLALERITMEKTAGIPDGMNTLLDVSLYYRPVTKREAR